ncbi:MAG: hypothetical protein ACKVGZ_09480 [Alphaproteobacteria bacterium]
MTAITNQTAPRPGPPGFAAQPFQSPTWLPVHEVPLQTPLI